MNYGAREDSWESLGLQGDQTSQSSRKSVLNILWKEWCWKWNSNTLATWCKELTQWKTLLCWERLTARGEGGDRGWDGWMASPLNGLVFERALGVGDGQGGLACCSPWGCKSQTQLSDWTELRAKELMLLNCIVGEDSLESLGLQGDPPSPS